METIKNYFFRHTGVMLGRSIRHILRSRDAMIILSMIMMPIAFILLFVYTFGSIIQTMEEIFIAIIHKKEK